ncbi:MAG: hypothetical protein AABZ60_24640 [Planctomycetota bacterium]
MKKTAHHEDIVGNNTQTTLTLKGITPHAREDRTWVCKYHHKYTAGYIYEDQGTQIAARYSAAEAENLFTTWCSRELNKDYN